MLPYKSLPNISLGWSVQKTKSKKPRPSSNIHNQLPSSNIESDQIQNRPIRGGDRQRRISDRNGHDHTQGEDFMFGSIDFFINFHEYNFKTDFLKKLDKIQNGSINQVYGRKGQKFSRRHNNESDSSSIKSNEPV